MASPHCDAPLVSSVDWWSSLRRAQARKYNFFTILESCNDLLTSMNSASKCSDFWLLSLNIWGLSHKIPQKLVVWSLYNSHTIFFPLTTVQKFGQKKGHWSTHICLYFEDSIFKKNPPFSLARFFSKNLSISKFIYFLLKVLCWVPFRILFQNASLMDILPYNKIHHTNPPIL
jgi:hypothetical protein